MSCFFLSIDVCFFVMEIVSFLELLSQNDGFGCGVFVFGYFSQFFDFVFLCCLLLLGVKFLFFEGTSLFAQFLEKISRIFPKIECFDSSDRENKDCKNSNNNGFVSNSNLVDGLDQKKPIILHWSIDSANGLSLSKKTTKRCDNCDLLLLPLPHDGIDLSENRDITAALPETEFDENNTHDEEEQSEDEESRSLSDEYHVYGVVTLRKMVKRERKRGDLMKLELEKERRAAKTAAEEAMAMLLKLRIEKSVVEMEAKQYKRVTEQKQAYDQEVIQSLQWMLRKLDDEEKIQH